MAKTPAQLQKAAIIADLQTLVNSGVLGSVTSDDFSKGNPFDRTWGNCPAVVVVPPTLSGNDLDDTGTNIHEYTWTLACVTTPENVTESDYLEGLVDSIVAVFDSDVTLQGTANAGLYPTLLDAPGIVNPPGSSASYVVFFVTFKARATVPAAAK